MNARTIDADRFLDIEDPIIDVEACIEAMWSVADNDPDQVPGPILYLMKRLQEHAKALRAAFNDAHNSGPSLSAVS